MKKILLGILTIYPIVYTMFFFIIIFSSFFNMFNNYNGGMLFLVFPVILIMHLLTIIDIMGLTIYYILHAVKNESLEQDMRIVWIVLILLGNMIAMPIYWYLNIWREDNNSEVLEITKE